MIFVFRMRAWVPGCLGGRSREAWAASPGSLGRIPGAPWGGVPAQCLRVVGGHAPLELASKIMSILMSIFGRFGVDLGSLLGVIFGPSGAFSLLSWSWNRLRTVLSSKKCFFTKQFKTNSFGRFFTQDGAPKRPKIAPRRVQDRLGWLFLSLDFSLRFLIV